MRRIQVVIREVDDQTTDPPKEMADHSPGRASGSDRLAEREDLATLRPRLVPPASPDGARGGQRN